MNARQAELLSLIKKEVKPALGCTEPIAVALAAAKAVECLHPEDPESEEWRSGADLRLEVKVSGNILKNGMGVGIPGTDMIGLDIAAALGALCGKSRYGLEVLNDVNQPSINMARQLHADHKVKISLADTPLKLYVRVDAFAAGHQAWAVIEKDHDNIVETGRDGIAERVEQEETVQGRSNREYGLTVKEIYELPDALDFEDIRFILESRTLNLRLAEEGLRGNYGLNVGRIIAKDDLKEVFGNDFMSYAMAMTAAASDARMAGCTLAAMSNSGSGNQGITVTMPVIAYAQKYNVSDEKLARALIIAHLTAIHIKSYLGKLSALCGCVIASTGASCGIVYLRDGSYEQVCAAIKNMIGNITGMVCDGAKVGCAMKVASGVSSAIQSAVLAMEGHCISEHEGIIEKDIEKTIRNLGQIGSVGMAQTDNMILDIMVCK